MNDFKLTTPVAFLIYNRPNVTEQVFQQIRNAKPAKLLIVADGPNPVRHNDKTQCAAARNIVNNIDWNCEVLRNFSDINLGCKRRVSTGLNWVFNMVDEAIILEDDCLPHPTFFRYCQDLLERYRDYERIMSIAGSNLQFGQQPIEYSYYFSRYVLIWGWATWRRAWKYYDVNMTFWPKYRDSNWLLTLTGSERAAEYWRQIFDFTYTNRIETWDYQYLFTCWLQNALSVSPNVNLVSNIGFGPNATHTKHANAKTANMPAFAMDFPLNHPPLILRNSTADDFLQKLYITGQI